MLNKNNATKHLNIHLQALLSTSGLNCSRPRHFSVAICLPEEYKSEEKNKTLSGQNAAAFLKDCARDDLFFQAEMKLENDSPVNHFKSE